MSEVKPTKLSYKEEEGWIRDYVHSHSSPSGWLKDLIIKEYKREQKINNGYVATEQKKESKEQEQRSNGVFGLLDD